MLFKMKNHNLTIAILFAATIEITISLIWFGIYPDLSQALLYLGVGFLLFVFAYIYEWMKRFQGEIKEQDSRLDSFDLWIRQEFKKINNKQEEKNARTNRTQ